MLRWMMIAAAILALPTGPAAAGETLDRVIEDGVLTMSTDPAYPPQSSLDGETNTFRGFDIDVGTEIAKRLGVSIEFVTPSWDVITAGRWAGRWDVSVGSMTATEERKQVLDFPAVYYYTPAALAVHQGNATITSVAGASGKRIGVGQATTYEGYLNKSLAITDQPPIDFAIDEAAVQAYETDLLALDDLRLGDGVRLDGVITALPTILDAIERGYPLKVTGEPLFKEPLAVAIDKGDPEFGAKLAEIVTAMREDGTLARLSEQWYGTNLVN